MYNHVISQQYCAMFFIFGHKHPVHLIIVFRHFRILFIKVNWIEVNIDKIIFSISLLKVLLYTSHKLLSKMSLFEWNEKCELLHSCAFLIISHSIHPTSEVGNCGRLRSMLWVILKNFTLEPSIKKVHVHVIHRIYTRPQGTTHQSHFVDPFVCSSSKSNLYHLES